MKIFASVIILFLSALTCYSQSFTIAGSNKKKGHSISALVDIPLKKKWSLGVSYFFVENDDFWNNFIVEDEVSFHKDHFHDETFISFEELDRGYYFPEKFIEKRPQFIRHHFVILAGYQLLKFKDFSAKIYLGGSVGTERISQYNWRLFSSSQQSELTSQVTINEGDEDIYVPFTNFQSRRDMGFGGAGRLDVNYSVFKNVLVGLSGYCILSQNISVSASLALNLVFNFSSDD